MKNNMNFYYMKCKVCIIYSPGYRRVNADFLLVNIIASHSHMLSMNILMSPNNSETLFAHLAHKQSG